MPQRVCFFFFFKKKGCIRYILSGRSNWEGKGTGSAAPSGTHAKGEGRGEGAKARGQTVPLAMHDSRGREADVARLSGWTAAPHSGGCLAGIDLFVRD